jgi:hypothetical protein
MVTRAEPEPRQSFRQIAFTQAYSGRTVLPDGRQGIHTILIRRVPV